MNFRRGRHREDPEINLIPMIDVLLVILIFLMVTTTYAKYTELRINLPQASGEASRDQPTLINVAVDAVGHYLVNDAPASFSDPDSFAELLRQAVAGRKDPIVAISADASATHQSVVNVMEAARRAGIAHVTFTTQGATGR
jgi:biopolymer transport protein ExbD